MVTLDLAVPVSLHTCAFRCAGWDENVSVASGAGNSGWQTRSVAGKQQGLSGVLPHPRGSPAHPSAGFLHTASDFSVPPTASVSLRITTSSGMIVSKSVLIILLEGCHDNLQRAPRGGVSVCTGGRQRKRVRETQAGRDRGRERIRENPSDISKSDLQPSWPPSRGQGRGAIHAAMSSWSNLGLTVGPVMGHQLLRASCHSCHGRAGPAGEAPWHTPPSHSQD